MKRYYFPLIFQLLLITSCNSGSNNSWYPVGLGIVTFSKSMVNLNIGESAVISATYSGGNVVVQPFLVTFVLSDTVATVNPNYCYLGSNVSCNLTITGITQGNAILSASSNYYPIGIESVAITVK